MNIWLKLALTASLVLALAPMDFAVGGDAFPFDAGIDGQFEVTEFIGDSPLFVVEESGVGYEPTLGAFTYTTYLFHNLARVPDDDDCGTFSSTAVGGSGVLNFADGQMRLQRVSGTACLMSSIIVLEEWWRIASGTGAYVGATGSLIREFYGDVPSGLGQGTIQGTIRLR